MFLFRRNSLSTSFDRFNFDVWWKIVIFESNLRIMAIKITESNLKKIISDSIKSIMESSGELLGSVNFGNEANLINAGKLQVIAPGDDSYNTYKEPVWNIL